MITTACEELERRAIQDQMVPTAMGGVLPEQSDSAAFRRVLDVGSGSGNWLIETGIWLSMHGSKRKPTKRQIASNFT